MGSNISKHIRISEIYRILYAGSFVWFFFHLQIPGRIDFPLNDSLTKTQNIFAPRWGGVLSVTLLCVGWLFVDVVISTNYMSIITMITTRTTARTMISKITTYNTSTPTNITQPPRIIKERWQKQKSIIN